MPAAPAPAPACLGLDSALKRGIFGSYVLLWVASHLLVYSSTRAGAPPYNATSVVLLTELAKLLLAVGLYFAHDGGPAQLVRAAGSALPLALRYVVPAGLYCIYNNLVYVNLSNFDPGTYNVLVQLRIVMTGGLYQVFFARRLRRNQWAAICLICAGCMAKEAAKLREGVGGLQANLGAWCLLLVQMLCSVLAGLYNELLLKGLVTKPAPRPASPGGSGERGGERGGGVATNLQNAFMYFNSVLLNAAFLLWQGRFGEAVSAPNIAAICSPTLLGVMLIMSSVGMVTGFFLKHLDSVLKAVASASEVVLTMLLSALLFGVPLDAAAATSALLVGAGVALYARPAPPEPKADAVELEALRPRGASGSPGFPGYDEDEEDFGDKEAGDFKRRA
jgi:drug/metabolite transporter (DMT)-like permease